ncbi:hypothetical protein [Jatrophihabitans sp.]|uniref:hypothetical protein n=1 Tax=Jatrophihabitans sp. TaxID=1932789 RepID=UPI002EE0C37A
MGLQVSGAPAVAEAPAGRREQALALIRRGQLPDARELLAAELKAGPSGAAWLTDAIIEAMQFDDLRFVGDLARISAELRHGGRATVTTPSASPAEDAACRDHSASDGRKLSAGKLRHDSDQLRYLRSVGILDGSIDAVIARYQQIADSLDEIGPEARRPLTDEDRAMFGEIYGRLVHIRPTPRLDRALSRSWDPVTVEDRYLTSRPGVVVIDDFLVPEALSELRAFCLESTVWNANRYPNGRLGAFFDSGFNCPLVLQIAEELRESFPRMIGDQHRLRQLWGFKYPPQLPPDSTIHADFAAVNVNFWITPERANRDSATGGLLIYDADAPREWDFATYNERLDLIKDFLRRSRAEVIYVPYRENRAIIFDSDLFHATAQVDFEPSYVDHRINVTMLYGVREHDDLHSPRSGSRVSDVTSGSSSGWRSAAFARTRLKP